ncbi:hypothetical protein C7212DRAFT_345397 [Tuber magnatum]|uniref:Uncharacterized protein n=1 Tax=Tuber magnatum TaxID=42249 RepID=A0A317SQI9_9PEZI|nr:hypothetical protein C7212DRAFT_345397 [Tuber magnatum]
MSKLAKKFRFERRNRATHRGGLPGLPGSCSLPNVFADSPSAIQQAVNAVSFSMAVPSSAAPSSGTQSDTNDSLLPSGLLNSDRYQITRVEDPRVQVVDDQGCPQSAVDSTNKPDCTHNSSGGTDSSTAVNAQKWLDETPSAAELEASRDEILEALAFDPEKGKNVLEREKNATILAKVEEADTSGLGTKPEDAQPPSTFRKNMAPVSRKRSVSSTTSSTLSSIDSELFYGCGVISPLDELDPLSERSDTPPAPPPPTIAIPEPVERKLAAEPIQDTSHNITQAAVGSSKGACRVLKNIALDRKPSIASKLNFKFKGKPIFSSKQASSTDGNPMEPNEDTGDGQKIYPKSLCSHKSTASLDQIAAEPEASPKRVDGKPASKFTGVPNILKPGQSLSSGFTTKPTNGNGSTLSNLSFAPTAMETGSQFFGGSRRFPYTQNQDITSNDTSCNREEPFRPEPSMSNATRTNRFTAFQTFYTARNFSIERSDSQSLTDIRGGPATSPGSTKNQTTPIAPPIMPAEAEEIVMEDGGNLNDSLPNKEKTENAGISSIPGSPPETSGERKGHPHSPLFDIHKRSSLTALRIQLDFFNKLLGDIQKKIDKLLIYQPTPALLERLRQLKHAHRGIILTLGAAPILADMKAAGYKGKLLADLEAFQARIDEYNWEDGRNDSMANPFGLPVEPVWHGAQFEED